MLPPFQSPDSVRNPSVEKCAVDSMSLDDENMRSHHANLPGSSNHCVSAAFNNVGCCNQRLEVDCENINSSGCIEDKKYPLTTTDQSCFEIDSVPTIKIPCLEPEANSLPGSSVGKSDSSVPIYNKVRNTGQKLVKKCRLIVKLSNIADPKSKEDPAANASKVLETMASQVCPVCKTFSSSSNTTLNAHIDQCLSEESTNKWTENSKTIKHRIKPRKIRLMEDIYATAQHCTLEELDRRNGTNWASNFGLPSQDAEMCTKEKNKKPSTINFESPNEEDSVYIDSNGTKLRILCCDLARDDFGSGNNKASSAVNFVDRSNEEGAVCVTSCGTKLHIVSSDLASKSNDIDNSGPRKLAKKDKRRKFLLVKKKKDLLLKDKLLQCASHDRKNCFTKPEHCFKIKDGQQRSFPPEESCHKEECLTEPCKAYGPIKFTNLGMIKHWVGSKRTGLTKTIKPNDKNQHSDMDVQKDNRVKSSKSSQGDLSVKRTSDINCLVSSGKIPLSPTGRSKSKEILSCDSRDGCNEQPPLRDTSRDCHKKKKHWVSPKFNAKKLGKDHMLLVQCHCIDPLSSSENLVHSKSNKRMKGLEENFNTSVISPRSPQCQVSSGGKKFSSLSKDLLPVSHASFPESEANMRSKYFDLKKPRVHCISGCDEETVASKFVNDGQHHMSGKLSESVARIGKSFDDVSSDRTRVFKMRKRRREIIMSSKPSHESSCQNAGKNVDSFTVGCVPPGTPDTLETAEREDEYWSDPICEPSSEISNGEVCTVFRKSVDPAFPSVSGPSDVRPILQQNVDAHKERCPDEPILGGERDIFCVDEVGNDMIGCGTQMLAKFVTEGRGNYFVDVDPIQIPGPPGSFLPSPGRIGSEDFHGNSSITTCRFQSSEDELELFDMVSSDSPRCAISSISNSIPARSNAMYLENSSIGPCAIQQEPCFGISGASFDSIVDCFTPIEQAASAGEGKLNLDEPKGNSMFPETNPPPKFRNDLSCCSTKEGALQTVPLDKQELQLLWQPAMAVSLPLPVPEKHMSDNLKTKLDSFNLSSEMVSVKEPSPKPQKYIAKSLMGHIPVEISNKSDVKFPTCGDCLCASPAANPVLRLMGKNLMLGNKDEDLCPHTGPAQSGIVNGYAHMQYCFDNGMSRVKSPNEDHSSHLVVSQGPGIFDPLQHSTPRPNFDVNSRKDIEKSW